MRVKKINLKSIPTKVRTYRWVCERPRWSTKIRKWCTCNYRRPFDQRWRCTGDWRLRRATGPFSRCSRQKCWNCHYFHSRKVGCIYRRVNTVVSIWKIEKKKLSGLPPSEAECGAIMRHKSHLCAWRRRWPSPPFHSTRKRLKDFHFAATRRLASCVSRHDID